MEAVSTSETSAHFYTPQHPRSVTFAAMRIKSHMPSKRLACFLCNISTFVAITQLRTVLRRPSKLAYYVDVWICPTFRNVTGKHLSVCSLALFVYKRRLTPVVWMITTSKKSVWGVFEWRLVELWWGTRCYLQLLQAHRQPHRASTRTHFSIAFFCRKLSLNNRLTKPYFKINITFWEHLIRLSQLSFNAFRLYPYDIRNENGHN
jgi:hypothetical protein